MTTTTAAALWGQLEGRRRTYDNRAIDAAGLTIPFLFPEDGTTADTRLRTPFQSVGARGVNNVASKLVLGLFPPASPFFRLALNRSAFVQEFGQDGLADVESTLVDIEIEVNREMETLGLRPALYQLFRLLQVTGTAILEVPDEGDVRIWPLRTFVMDRDMSDTLRTLVLREQVTGAALPAVAKARLVSAQGEECLRKEHTLFTVVRLMPDGRYAGHQELEKVPGVLPGTEGMWDRQDLPYLPQRWSRVAGESYGRGHVEEHIGDLRSLEGLNEAITKGSAAAAHFIWLLRPNGVTRLREIKSARTGDIKVGNPEDLGPMRLDKGQDFAVAQTTAQTIAERLRDAFLLLTPVRQAERVTAEEVRQVAQELNENLGGTFSSLTTDLQQPLLKRVIARMQRRGDLPELPEDVVEPKIITGLEGLSRGQEVFRLRAFLTDMAQTFGNQRLPSFLNESEVARRFANGQGLSSEGLVREEEEVEGDTQNAQLQQLTEKLGPEAIKQISQFIQNQENPTQ